MAAAQPATRPTACDRTHPPTRRRARRRPQRAGPLPGREDGRRWPAPIPSSPSWATTSARPARAGTQRTLPRRVPRRPGHPGGRRARPRRRAAVGGLHRCPRLTMASRSLDPVVARRRTGARRPHRRPRHRPGAARRRRRRSARAALGALHRLGDLTRGELLTALADPDPGQRRRACEVAATFAGAEGSPADPQVATGVAALLDDDDPAVVEVAAWAAGSGHPWPGRGRRRRPGWSALVGESRRRALRRGGGRRPRSARRSRRAAGHPRRHRRQGHRAPPGRHRPRALRRARGRRGAPARPGGQGLAGPPGGGGPAHSMNMTRNWSKDSMQ